MMLHRVKHVVEFIGMYFVRQKDAVEANKSIFLIFIMNFICDVRKHTTLLNLIQMHKRKSPDKFCSGFTIYRGRS